MQLKNYQDRVLGDLGRFLDALAESRSYRNARLNHDDEMVCETARQYNFVQKAWTAATGRTDYPAHKDGLGEWMPDVYLKVPTGGGKTLLACCAIDRIQRQYLRRQCGLVLWVMPTSQIYRQTMQKAFRSFASLPANARHRQRRANANPRTRQTAETRRHKRQPCRSAFNATRRQPAKQGNFANVPRCGRIRRLFSRQR